jgi:hypothetical protein
MTTFAVQHATITLPPGTVPVRPNGLLAGVRRPCREHASDCPCVARTRDGRLVFRCDAGGHHFSAR